MSEPETPGPEKTAAVEEKAITPAATPEDVDIETSGGKRLPAAVWAEIDTHWECGTMKGVDICKKYGISPVTLSRHFRRHDIKPGSKVGILKKTAEVKIMGAVTAAEDPVAVSFEQKRRGRIAQTREQVYTLSAWNAGRAATIAKAVQDGTRTMADAANELKSHRHMELLLKENTNTRLKILKAEHEVDEHLPTLVFRDLSEEEIQARSEADDDDDLGLALPEVAVDLEEEEIIEEGTPSVV